MNTLQVEGCLEPNRAFVLTSAITAFGNVPGLNTEGSGMVCELPGCANLEICGDGFNDRTVMVRYSGCYYFVYRRDLASAIPAGRIPGTEKEVGAGYAFAVA